MKHIKLFEGVTLSDEVIKLDYLSYMDLYEDESKRVDITKYEIEKIRKYFKQFPNLRVREESSQTTHRTGIGFISFKKNRLEVFNRSDKRFVISKLEDEWFLVHIFMAGSKGGLFKVDQVHTLFKVLDENLQKIGRIDVEKVERERIENNRILDMRNKLRHKIGIMSVEELDKWTKEWGL